MNFLLSAPAIIKVLSSLALILIVSRISKSLILAIFAGTVLLAFWAGHSFQSFGTVAFGRLSSRDNLFLLLIVLLIIWLSGQMASTGIMNTLVESFRSRITNRMSMAFLPALVGLLPMPGGALFSAPLVDDSDSGSSSSPILKGRINYWFRHIWEYWWPLYAGMLLAVELSGLQIWHFFAAGIPVTLFSIFGGWLFLLRKVEKKEKTGGGNFDLSSLIPIAIVISVYAAMSIFFPVVKDVSKYLPIAIGICIAIMYVQIRYPLSGKEWSKIIFSRKTVSLAVLVAVIRVYGAFMEAPLPNGSFIVELMRTELANIGIPVLPLIMVLPFLAGFTTGIAIGMVGASFPIVMQLAGSNPSTTMLLSTAILAFTAGHIGQLVSPVHVCLIVTNEYFKTSLLKSLRGLWGPCLILLAGGFIVSRVILLL